MGPTPSQGDYRLRPTGAAGAAGVGAGVEAISAGPDAP